MKKIKNEENLITVVRITAGVLMMLALLPVAIFGAGLGIITKVLEVFFLNED